MYKQNLLVILSLIIPFLGQQGLLYAEQDPFLDRETTYLADEEAANKVEYKAPDRFPGYGPYRNQFSQMCKYLILDNRPLRWNSALTKLEKEKEKCIPCRQLYRLLKCKIPRVWTSVESTQPSSVESTPSQVPTQIEDKSQTEELAKEENQVPETSPTSRVLAKMPATEFLAALNVAFDSIASDEKIVKETIEALMPFLQELEAKTQDTKEDHYYSIITSYVKLPFGDSFDVAQKKELEKKKRSKKKQLESLF